MLLLRDVLWRHLSSPYLLGEIRLKVPARYGKVLAAPFVRMAQNSHASLVNMIKEDNTLPALKPEQETFHRVKVEFDRMVMEALFRS